MLVLNKELKGKTHPGVIDLYNEIEYLNFTSTKSPNPEQHRTKWSTRKWIYDNKQGDSSNGKRKNT